MVIKRSSFWFKVVYGLEEKPERIPQTTNLCSFFWNFLFKLFMVWPFVLIIFLAMVLFGSFSMFLFGFKPNFSNKKTIGFLMTKDEIPIFVEIKNIPQICGWRLVPIYFVLLFGLAGAFALYTIPSLVTLGVIVAFVLFVCLLFGVNHLIQKIRKSNSVLTQVVKDWKEGICTRIEFVDEAASEKITIS